MSSRPQTPAEVSVAVSFGMSRVVSDHPSAVLLVDLDTRQVVYANDLAGQLAPDTRLPVDVDAWSRAAGLQSAGGEDLDTSQAPLHRLAAGSPLTGEQVTAKRSSDVSAAREDLWVIGTPLQDAPPPLDRRALVVFLPLRDQAGVERAQQAGFELQHQAVVSSEVSFCISDPHAEDDPLVWVNPAFERTTGYRAADVVGTNCRFLQGPGTDPAAVQRIRDGLREGGTITETLLNYRADGTAFWNNLVISPIHDADGNLTHHVGVQTDVTERVDADADRNRALAQAQEANGRLAALAAVSAELADNLDTGDASLDKLPGVVAAHFPGWIVAVGLDQQRTVTRVSVAHSDPERRHALPAVAETLREWSTTAAADLLIRQALDRLGGSAPLHATVAAAPLRQALAIAGLGTEPLTGPDGAAVVVAPLTARGAHVGLLAVIRDGDVGFSDGELAAIADLGVRAGVALDNARLYAREHAAALTLQRSLLPTLPTLDGFDVAAIYQPALNSAEVGGDWYDVLPLPDDMGIGVAVGDVMGHDLRAAAAMGQLRSVLRSYAWSGDGPAEVIGRLDELVRGLDMASLATCAYGIVCRHEDGTCKVVYTLAGHPPPMVRHPDGRVEHLADALTSPIGVAGDDRTITQAEADLPVGAHLVLYTDGLVERRRLDIDDSIAALTAALAAAPEGIDADGMTSYLVETLTTDDHDDDICVLVLHRTR